jgi:hypothetical protein
MFVKKFVLACMLLLALNAFGQAAPQDLVNGWLDGSCGNNDLSPLADQLKGNGDAVLPLLITAATQGPDAAYLARISTAAGQSYDLLQAQLASGSIRGLTNAQNNLLTTITKDQMVSDQVNAAVLAYESRALGGLAVVGGDQAIQILIWSDLSSLFRGRGFGFWFHGIASCSRRSRPSRCQLAGTARSQGRAVVWRGEVNP